MGQSVPLGRQPAPWRSGPWVGIVVALLFLLLALRQHLFVDSHAVNVMFWDQWDFYQPLFDGGGLWDMFSRQHGPHRQGLGMLLTALLAWLSDWNSRWDAFGVSFVLIAAALAGLALTRRCGMRGFGLVVVPLLFFNPRQYESFVAAANISHGAMPLLLLMILCLVWFVENRLLRHLLLGLCTFLLIFTGFGLFAGLVVPAVLAMELARRLRKGMEGVLPLWLALAAIACSWLLFFHGYRFDPAVQGFTFPHPRPGEYLLFMASMLNNFFGITNHGAGSLVVGMALLLFLALIAFIHGRQLWRHGLEGQGRSATLVVLALFALLFCCQTAVGRVVLGWKAASSTSRYVPLLVPGALAMALHLAGLGARWRPRQLVAVFALVVAVGTTRLHRADISFIDHYRSGRLAWKAAYLATGDMGKAGELTGFLIYPAVMLDERLDFLRGKRLNLFNPDGLP